MGPISSRQSPFVAGPSPNVKKPMKMVMCVNFNNSGHCDRGETCTYAHGLSELHEYRMKQVPNYRTTLCQTWSSQGSCSYGDTCMYAHGNHELRVKNPASDLAELGISGPDSKRIRL